MSGYKDGKPGGGASVKNETSIVSKLYEMTNNKAKSYYICWKYAPDALPNKNIKTFEELKNTYKYFSDGITEETAKGWEIESNVQACIKYVLKRTHQHKMIELYNLYFEKSKEDTAAFKMFCQFSNEFFATEKESELLSILKGVNFSDDDDIANEDEEKKFY